MSNLDEVDGVNGTIDKINGNIVIINYNLSKILDLKEGEQLDAETIKDKITS